MLLEKFIYSAHDGDLKWRWHMVEVMHENVKIVRDIEPRVFQAVVIKCLAGIVGISFLEGTLFDHLLGREGLERIKGVSIEKDDQNQLIDIKIELNITYGLSIPEKAVEIETKLISDVLRLTGCAVRSLHVIFKNVFFEDGFEEILDQQRRGFEEEPLNMEVREEALTR